MVYLVKNDPELPLKEADEHALRLIEAFIFSSPEPVSDLALAALLPEGTDVALHLNTLMELYSGRGFNLVRTGAGWHFQTASEFAMALAPHREEKRRMSKAQLETLAIVAYHQPVTRAEIEDLRGVSITRTVMDALFEAGWIKSRGRRKTLGRPMTYGTSLKFLKDFGLEKLSDLPGLAEMKASGLFEGANLNVISIPTPHEDALLFDDEAETDALKTWDEDLSFDEDNIDAQK